MCTSPWEESQRDTLCVLCVHEPRREQTDKMWPRCFMWLDSCFEDLGLVLYNRATACERREQSTCHRSRSAWKDLFLCLYCAVMPQKFTDFKSLDIVPSITGHWCHLRLWVSVNTLAVRSQSQSSQNIFQANLWRPQFFHRRVRSSVRRGCISVCACVTDRRSRRTLWLTLPSWCQIKAWQMVASQKKGTSLATCSFSYLIDTLQLQRFMSRSIPGWVRLTATCGNMICFELVQHQQTRVRAGGNVRLPICLLLLPNVPLLINRQSALILQEIGDRATSWCGTHFQNNILLCFDW